MTLFYRIIIACGFLLDAGVALIALALPQLLESFLDIPYHDSPALAAFAGGEFAVVAVLYAIALRDPRRYPFLFWIFALDQGLATIIPAIEILRGHVPATFMTVAPIPVVAILCILYIRSAIQLAREPSSAAPRSTSRGT